MSDTTAPTVPRSSSARKADVTNPHHAHALPPRSASDRMLNRVSGGTFGKGEHRAKLSKLFKRRSTKLETPITAVTEVQFYVKACRTMGAVQSILGKEKVTPFETVKIAIYGTAAVFGDEQKSWNRSYDKARQIFASAGTPAIAVAMQTEHAMLFDSRMAITSSTRSGKLRCATDWVKLFRVGEEDEDAQAFATETGASVACAAAGRRGSVAFNTRRFTWVMRDDVLYVTETGKGTMKDFMSKHAVLANGALAVRCAGEMLFVHRADIWRTIDEVRAQQAKAAADSAAAAAYAVASAGGTIEEVQAAVAELGGDDSGSSTTSATASGGSAAAAPPTERTGDGARAGAGAGKVPLPFQEDTLFDFSIAMELAGFTDPDPSRENEMVLIIDNESGTYGPVWYHLARAAEVLRNCGGGLTVLPLDYHDPVLKLLKSTLCRM